MSLRGSFCFHAYATISLIKKRVLEQALASKHTYRVCAPIFREGIMHSQDYSFFAAKIVQK